MSQTDGATTGDDGDGEHDFELDDLNPTSELSLKQLAAEARRLAAQTSARQAELEDKLADSMKDLAQETRALREYLQRETPTYEELDKRLAGVEELARGRMRTMISYGALIVAFTLFLSVLTVEWGRNFCYQRVVSDEPVPACHIFFPLHDDLPLPEE